MFENMYLGKVFFNSVFKKSISGDEENLEKKVTLKKLPHFFIHTLNFTKSAFEFLDEDRSRKNETRFF